VNPQAPRISDLSFFAGVSAEAKKELESLCVLRQYDAGAVVLTPGVPGEFLYAIFAGAVSVLASPSQRDSAILLGPGEVFGEMALLSRTAVSAHVVAARDSRIFLLPSRVFDRIFSEEPAFRRNITDLLAERLRVRTVSRGQTPTCVFIAAPSSSSSVVRVLAGALARAVDSYARVFEAGEMSMETGGAMALGSHIDSWRASARVGDVCIALCEASKILELQAFARAGDAVLLVVEGSSTSNALSLADWGKVDLAVVRVGAAARGSGAISETWAYRLDDAEIRVASRAETWNRRSAPVLDSIARWIARRTIGIALGAGAARGFAHIGVLATLDAAGIPVDCLSGSSIGGIIALLYAMSGSAQGAYDLARRTIGSNKLIRDVSIIPRASLIRGLKVRRSAERITGGKTFTDLTRPAFAVAADLITGRRAILDRGPIHSALVATAAIPGVLPPIKSGGAWLVDGALVTRVPVDLLDRWRCGLKIAVNVDTDASAEDPSVHAKLRRSLERPFSLTTIIARTWELLGISQGVAESKTADIVINPLMPSQSGYDFDAIDSLVAAGKLAAEQVLPDIRDAVEAIVRPR
jgi:NTE family protein